MKLKKEELVNKVGSKIRKIRKIRKGKGVTIEKLALEAHVIRILIKNNLA